jgi:septal ring factor EnvC (AmiA/AmiB activator)
MEFFRKHQKIIKQDYRRMAAARAKAKEIALLKYSIEEKKRELAHSIKTINYQQQSIQREIAQNENMIHKLRTDRVAYEKAEKELAKQSASIGTMINRSSDKYSTKTTTTCSKTTSETRSMGFNKGLFTICDSTSTTATS